MKSVFKTVAPIAMTITFALSGVAMADTATAAAKSADTTTPATESAKPVVHHHKLKPKAEEAAKTTGSAATEKSTSVKPAPASAEKVAPTENSKGVEPVKAK